MSYIFKSLDNDNMEIGQTTGQELFVKLNRWDGECNIKLDLTGDKSADIQQISANELRWVGNKFDFKFEKKTPMIEFVGSKKLGVDFVRNERNGIELYIILKEKPVQNYIEFPISEENLNFFYQPPYTQEQIDKGHVCPPWVEGSYAVYHKTKKNHVIGKTNYMVGKAFHIYRPIVMDNNSNLTFGELSIVDGKMRITVDSDFIQNAVYPVTIDPNFGYETQGTADYEDVQGYIMGWEFLNSQGSGTGDSITACLYANKVNVKCALYDDAANPAYIQTTDERNSPASIPGKTKDFYTFNFSSSPTIDDDTDYSLVAWGGSDGGGSYVRLYYDTVGAVAKRLYNLEAYNTWPDTLYRNTATTQFSIYCTFTLGVAYIPKVIMIT